MSLSHSKRQKAAKRSHELRVVRDNAWGLLDRVLLERMPASAEACIGDVVRGKNLYALPDDLECERLVYLYRLLSNCKFSLTVKIRSRMAREF